MSERNPKLVDVPISAPGPTQKMVNNPDGTTHVLPGKAHEAKEGVVSTPGVKTIATGRSGAVCPNCNRSNTLKVRMNRPTGQRIYCTACGYDQSKPNSGLGGTTSVSAKTPHVVEGGVKILRQRGPKG